ncbi:hypothetical protein HW571_03300 [Agrobacterium genomosp. 3]|uniref:hypothetical protein n=1 Tax=Rhizobium/Agrobacterium group TaxID=227290 RepID=UPI001B48753F|nr:hypothetical protein [Rhizobium rhizogenes]MBP8939432.1 hypothetical protein [Agrobacterium sp.]MCA1864691.1 hypothetical protein [Agrobacterium tomkonis]MCA1875312.1 hypothetical protein [Agrobacterium tumefaciens]MCA2379475.1 hypothetical protein [Agrobacterium tomkonis RTP8]MCA1891228.1 hypothetical protein [Agrobacterium tomkonis]
MFAASGLLNHLIDRADAEPVCHPAFFELQENSNLWDPVRRGSLVRTVHLEHFRFSPKRENALPFCFYAFS